MDDDHHFVIPEVDQVAGPGTDAESPRPPHDPEEDLPGIADTPQEDRPVPGDAPEGGDQEPEPDADPATSGSA